jgi:hypothetical protein
MTIATVNASALPASQTLGHASKQWRDRPADERFTTLEALRDATVAYRDASKVVSTTAAKLRADVRQGEVVLIGPGGGGAIPTHHAFGQLCSRVGAPAGYLRQLPGELAAQALDHGLREAGSDVSTKLLLRNGAEGREVHAITSDSYGRVWNAEIAQRLVDLQAAQPYWTFPEAFRKVGGRAGQAGKTLPVAFASDHDLFVFLTDYEHGVEVRQADGSTHTLARGFTISNSEVGAGRLEARYFLFDYVCSNVLIWGARVLADVDIVHRGKARARFADGFADLARDLRSLAHGSAREEQEQISRAQRTLVADTKGEVVSTLFGRFGKRGLSKGIIEAAYEVVAETPRYGDPRSVWAVTNGLTEVSQRAKHADERRKVDELAADVLSMAF